MSETERFEPRPLIEEIGGEDVVRRLVDRFYDLMDELPEARTIRAMHAKDLKTSRQHLFDFLVFWMGGRDTYVQERGHPRLRRRHFPFAVDSAAAQAWMRCMNQALEEVVEDPMLRLRLGSAFGRIAQHMRNQP